MRLQGTWLLWLMVVVGWRPELPAAEVWLKNGMRLEGQLGGPIPEIGGDPLTGQAKPGQLIMVLDDGLRRTFFSVHQQDRVSPDVSIPRKIEIDQRVASGGAAISSVGQILEATPFDAWGRRRLRLVTPRDVVDVVQGITEITPVYTKVEGLVAYRAYQWDMRLATTSIPKETLSAILYQSLDKTNANDRLAIVAFYIQSERYQDALEELKGAMADFPELARLEQQQKELQQLMARQMVGEIVLRRNAGQHRLVRKLLAEFPAQDVAQDVLLEVKELSRGYEQSDAQIQQARKLLADNLAALGQPALQKQLEPLQAEIAKELNSHTLSRLADFLRFAEDKTAGAEQKLSLAISGWLLGSGAGIENLAVAHSLIEVRELVRQYLRTTPQQKTDREAILDRLTGLEGSTPQYVARLMATMKPPREAAPASAAEPSAAPAPASGADGQPPPTPAGDAPPDSSSTAAESPADTAIAGRYVLTTAGLPGDADIQYLVQLPPEYDPYRRYPTIVTLHAAGTTPEMQTDWWAGQYDPKLQQLGGQATRHGYIVIAPSWLPTGQRRYGYSAREHAAALFSLRDACQRFSVDTDRVFLSGHSAGGDAAWDIGLAHPDLWAGVIPVVATAYRSERTAPQYVRHYWPNAKQLALYFVIGEKDDNSLRRNGIEFDRYLRSAGFDTLVVQYIGRGHEHYYEEIHRLLQWMNVHVRRFPLAEFTCSSMRPSDNFFWWAELDKLPSPAMVAPLAWPPDRPRPMDITGKLRAQNSIFLRAGAGRTLVWLTPDMADFSQQVTLDVDGQRRREIVNPSTEVMLEDARTRGDRLHPFWAKLEFQGRVR